jgi:hydroxylamine reductase
MDAGHCNASPLACRNALKLKEVSGLDDIINLPIIYNIAWYEQKAVIVQLACCNSRQEDYPSRAHLPSFLSLNVAKVLVENFGSQASERETIWIVLPENRNARFVI